MDRLFRQIGETELYGSQATLNSLQGSLRENRSSGMIEVQLNATRQIVLVFANGTQVGAYLREGSEIRPFRLEELPVLWGGAPLSLRAATLPDKAGRALWLMLESRWQDRLEVPGGAAWDEVLKRWNNEKFDGVVEVTSEAGQGFSVIHAGEFIASESIFCDGNKFDASLPERLRAGGDWTISTYKPSPAAKAWQTLTLRLGALRWGNGVLDRFQSIAGLKFLQVVDKEIRILIQPWRWMILLDETRITDEHFFTGPEATAQAYRTIFMGMGTQMSFVIGNNLTQRILTEIFEELDREERIALESKRLIPAAFSA